MNRALEPLFGEIAGGKRPAPGALLDALEPLLPLVGRMADTPQEPEWHAEGNVRVHTEMVVDEVYKVLDSRAGADVAGERRLALVLSAALHDIGKVLTTCEAEIGGRVRITSPRHAAVGRSYLAPRLAGAGAGRGVWEMVLATVGHHHDPKKLVYRSRPERGFRRLGRCADVELVYLLEIADTRGRICDDGGEGLEMLELFWLGAQEWGVAGAGDPYAGWRERLRDEVGDEGLDYVFDEAVRWFESGEIAVPEEAIGRAYEYHMDGAHPEVLVTCGTSGSGKSRWVREALGDGWEVIELDALRLEVTGKAGSQAENGKVLQLAKERLREVLRRKGRVVWDATSLREDGRAMVLGMAHDYHAATRLVAFAVPPEEAMRRDRGRERMVGAKVIGRQFDRLMWPNLWEAQRVDWVLG